VELVKTIVIHVALALVMGATVFASVWIDMTYHTHHLVPVGTAFGLVALNRWASRRFWPDAR
jgi:hypothetical protein